MLDFIFTIIIVLVAFGWGYAVGTSTPITINFNKLQQVRSLIKNSCDSEIETIEYKNKTVSWICQNGEKHTFTYEK